MYLNFVLLLLTQQKWPGSFLSLPEEVCLVACLFLLLASHLNIRARFLEQQALLRQHAESSDQSTAQILPENIDLTVDPEQAFLKQIVTIVESELSNEGFSIAALSQKAGISRTHLNRKVKALTGYSPSVFVRTLRLQHAYRLLELKAGNISEIAFRVGIPNLSYFSRCFRDQFGFPPSKLLRT